MLQESITEPTNNAENNTLETSLTARKPTAGDDITTEHVDATEINSANMEHSHPKTEKASDEGFCCVMSMADGIVLYTTPSITNSLEFPRDMWLGRSFIDFVHPKDR